MTLMVIGALLLLALIAIALFAHEPDEGAPKGG